MNSKLLIIDDYLPVLEELKDFFKFEGYTVFSSESGAGGIRKALSNKPDLIICDIQMPEIDGYEVFRTLSKIPETALIPFVFLTAKASPEDFRKGMRLGADDYVIKPVDLEELAQTVHKRLSKHKQQVSVNNDTLSALLQNPLAGIYILDKNGFSFVNERFSKLLSYSQKELRGKQFTDFLISDKESFQTQINLCLSGVHSQFHTKVSLLTKDKRAVLLNVFGKQIELDKKNSIIGSVTEMNYSAEPKNGSNTEIKQILKNLEALDKYDIAEEIRNTMSYLSFIKEKKKKSLLDSLKFTKREKEVLQLICKGFTNQEIAEKLFISTRTVENHRAGLLSKSGTKNTAALVAFAVSENLVSLTENSIKHSS